MPTDAYTAHIQFRARLELARAKAEQDWLRELEEKGEEPYYDMTDAKERGLSCDCDEPCGQPHTILVGKWKSRPRQATSRTAKGR